jgi:hypothetical protein
MRRLPGDGRVEAKLREQLPCQLLEFIRLQREYLVEHALRVSAFAAENKPAGAEGDSISAVQPCRAVDPFCINSSAVGGTQILEQPVALEISKSYVPS